MKVPFSWLKELVDIDITAQELEDKLFSCGFEVEERIDLSAGIDKVVVGVITSIEKQEGTHLSRCVVDCGPYGRDIRITTGAPNIFVGAHVPAALDGATLPGGIRIQKRMMQGYESNGMLCSGEELGLNDDLYPGAGVYGLLILPEDTAPGAGICPLVGLDDSVFDISITANRPDCQSILGIAREVAAVLHKPLHMPATDYRPVCEADAPITVTVEAPDLCPRYMAHYVRNIRMGQSPRWMKRHLALCGLRSISNVVDITNHTLLEMGQPMHAFDLDKVAGRCIDVRRARPGEKIVTLDEKEFTLGENNLVICDAEKPVALAGVMGGANSGMDENTTSLLFECATFARDSVRKTSRALGQSSDSSARYEKGVDFSSPQLGLARALHLIQQLDCGDITTLAFDCTDGRSTQRKVITTTPEKICAVLGIRVPDPDMIDILTRLNFEVTVEDGQWKVSVPPYREDVEGYPDLAEEVIREYGYDKLTPTFLKTAAVTTGGLNGAQKAQMKLKRLLCGQGCFEASTLAFYSPADLDALHLPADDPARKVIPILNPISVHLSIMRTLLAPSMLKVIVDNLKKGNGAGRLFEMGNVYLPKQLPLTELPKERMTLCLGVFGPEEDFFTVKGLMEAIGEAFGVQLRYERDNVCWLHPGMTASVWCGDVKIGVFGKLANDVTAELKIAKDEKAGQNIYLAELDWEAFSGCVPSLVRYKPLSEFAPVRRDLALVCDEAVACGDIEACMRDASKLVTGTALFDIYRGERLGEGKKSLAFTLTFHADDRALTDEEVDAAVRKILKKLDGMGVTLRS